MRVKNKDATERCLDKCLAGHVAIIAAIGGGRILPFRAGANAVRLATDIQQR